MTVRPRTIQIFLPKGDPRGIRVAELTIGIERVVEVPRSLLDDFLSMTECQQVGVYLLINDDDGLKSSAAYIGQTSSLGQRLAQHHKSKDFWNRALVAVSVTNSLTNTHALYLEWLAIKSANEAGRYKVENGTVGSKPHTPKPMEADCLALFDNIRTLVTTLGQPVFEPLSRARISVTHDDSPPVAVTDLPGQPVGAEAPRADGPELFYCRGSNYDATAEYTEEGIVVLKGSKARKDASASFTTRGEVNKKRDMLIQEGTLLLEGNFYVFQRDVLFKSPSAAAVAVRGTYTNGWDVWVDANGRSLDELKRRAVTS